jgi:phosphoribosylamine--glycine ligase
MSQFIWCTRDFSGLGFAVKLQDEGCDVIVAFEPDPDQDPEKDEAYSLVGSGIVEREPMAQVFKNRTKHRAAYWIFDSNYLWEYADKLRKEGFKVFGASELTSKMEHDRDYGVSIAKKSGLDIPPMQTFSDVQDAIAFLESQPNKAYVCKPDDADSHLTYVPQSETPEAANRELRAYLLSMDDGQEFLLQQKMRGVEVNVECFFYKGRPYFAWVELECKRKNSGDKGELTGCSQDLAFIVDMNAPIVANTVAKMFPYYENLKYTGFGDLNVILADNQVYFIEFCNRFGYDAHATLFSTLRIKPFREVLANIIDGKGIDDAYTWFRKGFGAGIRLYLDNPKTGFPLFVSKDVKDRFYHYEAYQDGNQEDPEQDFCLAGFGGEVGIITGFGYTMKDAAKNALENALKINYPCCAYREDLDEENYPSSPIKREQAISAMGLL